MLLYAYTSLPHNLIKEKIINLIESTFQRECSPYRADNDSNAFFTSDNQHRFNLVKRCVTHYPIFYKIFTFGLALRYTDKLWEFQ